MPEPTYPRLPLADLLKLKRWNTPSISNGWEQITRLPANAAVNNREQVHDFMPHMGPMVGYAVTLVIQPSNAEHRTANLRGWSEYRRYVAEQPGPKIVVVQDLDTPRITASFWGEVNANVHRALGCVGAIVDGAIRDLDEMRNAGFKALARQLCVSHAYSWPVRWGCEVEAFGCRVAPGQLIHADKHGFIAVPPEDEAGLLEATQFMDANECNTVIAAARSASGRSTEEMLAAFDQASAAFGQAARSRFGREGEFAARPAPSPQP
jgi:regulator of RNase E activity RraA